jgi:hypothetical protein
VSWLDICIGLKSVSRNGGRELGFRGFEQPGFPTTISEDTLNMNVSLISLDIEYSAKTLNEIRSLCMVSDFIELSLMTNQFIPVVSIIKYLKTHGVAAPIIWGGIQPAVEPEECLEYADIVCL